MPYRIATFREVKRGREVFWDVCVENGVLQDENLVSKIEEGRGCIIRSQTLISTRKKPDEIIDHFAKTHPGGEPGFDNAEGVEYVRYGDSRRKGIRYAFTAYFEKMVK